MSLYHYRKGNSPYSGNYYDGYVFRSSRSSYSSGYTVHRVPRISLHSMASKSTGTTTEDSSLKQKNTERKKRFDGKKIDQISGDLSLHHIISLLIKAKRAGEDICVYVDKDTDLGLSNFKIDFKRKDNLSLYSTSHGEDYWFMSLTGKTKNEFYKYVKSQDDIYKSQKNCEILYNMSDEVYRISFEEILTIEDFYKFFELLKTARAENKNVTVYFVSADHKNTRFILNSLTYTEQQLDLVMHGLQREYERVSVKTRDYYYKVANPFIFPDLVPLWKEFVNNNTNVDEFGHVTEIHPSLTDLIKCLTLVYENADVEQIRPYIEKDSTLLSLILQFSKNGPEFTKSYLGDDIMSEEKKLINKIKKRNASFESTSNQSKTNPLREKLIKKIKSSGDSGSNTFSK